MSRRLDRRPFFASVSWSALKSEIPRRHFHHHPPDC
ncbi:hypothetical protein CASFOL_017922 [Castilleja foliolosa]|uniref:Uncharacterized protein n=1 Tax=Castilleja foliolosa TaxID=1961234 RepID=A0ABD3DAD1_9LAMI